MELELGHIAILLTGVAFFYLHWRWLKKINKDKNGTKLKEFF